MMLQREPIREPTLPEDKYTSQPAPDTGRQGDVEVDIPNNQSMHSNAAELLWNNITCGTSDVKLLHECSGRIRGKLLAIMGPSGSGKTTLLNILACRSNNVKIQGESLLNGQEYSNHELKSFSGYVMQDDLLSAHLTVMETLWYTAKLRLPSGLTEVEVEKRINDVIEMVGLERCRNVIVGDPTKKGISGGERKRLCIGIELLAKPNLLFLDEPTSGLDSVTSLQIVKLLKDITKHCTVLTTIHQPSAKIFDLFDKLMLLCRGQVVYYGDAKDTVKFFDAAGYPVPPFTNQADHFMDVLKENENRIHLFLSSAPSADNNSFASPTPGASTFVNPENKNSWFHKFKILLRKSLQEQYRNKGSMITQLISCLIMSVLIGTVFLRIGHGQWGITRRQPVLFFCCVNQGILGALTVINLFPSDRVLMLRERASGTYPVSAYLIARSLAETVMQIIIPIIFSIIVYFLVGLDGTASKFFTFMGFMILCSLTATSMGLCISAVCRTTQLSVTVLPIALEISRLFGGFFLAPANLPKYFVWLDALSYLKYCYVGVSLNELTNLELHCKPFELVNGRCPITSGDTTIRTLGFDDYTIGGCAGALVAMIVGYRIMTYLALRYIKW